MTLRRFETYGFAERTGPAEVATLARVLTQVGRFIPEVLDSAVGRNRSAVGVDFVWEHAFEGPDAYARYMRHPYHICVLDRYLLPESPECITASRRDLQLGLLGYEIEGAAFRRTGGIRRIVVMKVAPGTAPGVLDGFLAGLRAGPLPGLRVSIAEANTMGLEWFPDGWTHVWEQAYDDEASMRRAMEAERAVLDAGPLVGWADIWYEIEADVAPSGGAW